MGLIEYRRKRKFASTKEPKGRRHSAGKQLEFVVQKHDASRLHYDFRLELDGVLKSWAVPKGPSLNPEDKHLAIMVEDHPYDYRTFEGEIPEGNYGAGDVIVWDRGTYEPRAETDNPQKELRAGLHKGHLTFILHGQKLKGEFALIKKGNADENAWLLVKKGDEYASSQDVTQHVGSAMSNRVLPRDVGTGDDIVAPEASMPRQVKPMLATLAEEPFDDDDWLYEIKWDGYRAVASWDGKKTQLYSRNGNGFSKKYSAVVDALGDLPKPCVLDGEVVAVDQDGKSRFEWLQNYMQEQQGELQYQAFDLLWLEGKDLTDLPLIKRKELLKQLVSASAVIHYSDHVVGQGKQFFTSVDKAGLEGMMAKQSESIYRAGFRSKRWLKVKTHKRQEVVIGGFTEPKGSRKHIGALVMGVYEYDKLRYVGHTGGGLPKDIEALRQKLEKFETKSSPFADKFKTNSPVHWVQPKLLAEVKFAEWTKDGHLRQPIFIAMRTDKDPKTVIKEVTMPTTKKPKPKSDNAGSSSDKFEFSHRDKVFFPKTKQTKGDLIDYYEAVSDTILPYLKNRPCNLLRQPNGINGNAFFQKDMRDAPDWVKTEAVYSESNKKELHYYICDGKDALMYMIQLGSIEINPWSSRLGKLDKPDWAVIDLDPEGVGFDKVIECANVVHDVCEELKIPNYPKTSGKTGIHIFIPMHAKYAYDQVRQFSQLLATLINERTSNYTSLERNPKKREHKIYLDFLQNRESQTLAAPYSVRPTETASVSTPLHWDEVKPGLDPAKFTIKNTMKRIEKEGDLWKPVLGAGIDMKKILSKLE